MKQVLLHLLLITSYTAKSQITFVPIDSCYKWAERNYPLIKRVELIAKSNEYLPQLSLNAKASYQSDVTIVKFPGVTSWNLSSLSTSENEKNILRNNMLDAATQKETLLFNSNLTLTQQDNEKQKLNNLLQADDEIIRLKESIRLSTKAKYENGVSTLSDYVKKINAVNQARLNQSTHKIHSITNQYNRQFTLSN